MDAARRIRRIHNKRHRSSQGSYRSKYIFNSKYEEKKTIEYCINLIRSRFLNRSPEYLTEIAEEVLGERVLLQIAKRLFPEKKQDLLGNVTLQDELSSSMLSRALRTDILAALENRLEKLQVHRATELEKRLDILRDLFGLNDIEIELTVFFFLLYSVAPLGNNLTASGIVNITSLRGIRNYGHIVLNLKRDEFSKVFNSEKLIKVQMLQSSAENGVSISDWCMEYLYGKGRRDLAHEFYDTKNIEHLEISDFDIKKESLEVIDTLLTEREKTNLLVHGLPGTGKTSFGRCLGKKYQMTLYSVKQVPSDNISERISAIHATLNAAANKDSIILIDEADDLLNSIEGFFHKSRVSKSWINNLLDSHDQKIIWITNRTSDIDPSTLRRFDFRLRFSAQNQKARNRILNNEIRRLRMKRFFSDEEIAELSRNYNVNADAISSSLKMVRNIIRSDKQKALLHIHEALGNYEEPLGEGKGIKKRGRAGNEFILEGANTSIDLNKIIESSARHIKKMERESFPTLSMLFHGKPGTGKTEFVHYLGREIGLPVTTHRASDIYSKWIGETEENIARAFRDSEQNDSILFFDEADTFLFPRSNAVRSWEVSVTNEVLTQLEVHNGIVVFATNDFDGLDHAAIRRFVFKVEFSPLIPKQVDILFKDLLAGLGMKCSVIEGSDVRALHEAEGLVPADFSIVKRSLIYTKDENITNKHIVEALLSEIKLRRNGRKIGFSAPGLPRSEVKLH